MDRLPHGYTNRTRRLSDGNIEKIYVGPARFDNARREAEALERLAGHLPVPRLLDFDPRIPRALLSESPGTHGQELIDAGHARHVLRLVGRALAQLQAFDPSLVHGDFGPQNMLLDLARDEVTAIIDWESAHEGSPVEDLAWAEWIVREHHPHAVDALPELFAASGLAFPWRERHDAMLRQMSAVMRYCEDAGFGESAADWRRRIAMAELWVE